MSPGLLTSTEMTDSFNVAVEKGGLLKIAGGLVSLLKPKKMARLSCPSSVQRRKGSGHERMAHQSTVPDQVRNPCSETTNQALSTKSTTQSTKYPDTIIVPRKVLLQIAHSLARDSDFQKTVNLFEDRKRELAFLGRRLQYLDDTTRKILNYYGDQKDILVKRGNYNPSEHPSREGILDVCTERVPILEKALEDIKKKERGIENYFDQVKFEYLSSKELALNSLLNILGLNMIETSSGEENFDIQSLIDPESLRLYTNDCDSWTAMFKKGRYRFHRKYPSFPKDDWHVHYLEFVARRRLLDELEDRIWDMERKNYNCSNVDGSELDMERRIVELAQESLEEAAEAVRFAGVTCRLNGSLILTYHSPTHSSYSDYLEDEDEDVVDEAEFQRNLTQSRTNAERWLSSTNLDEDPDQVGPITPCTVDTNDFSEKLEEVLVEDSVSNVDYAETDTSWAEYNRGGYSASQEARWNRDEEYRRWNEDGLGHDSQRKPQNIATSVEHHDSVVSERPQVKRAHTL